MGFPSLALEPNWKDVAPDQLVTCMVETIVWGDSKSLVRSSIHGKFLVAYGSLPRAQAYTIFDGKVLASSSGIRVDASQAIVLDHITHDDSAWSCAIEGCSGIGCLGTGLRAAGFEVKAANDLSKPMLEVQALNGREGLVHGDLGSPKTLQELHQTHRGASLLAGGFSCQPWSRLGDGQHSDDPRSSALIFMLRSAFFLRSYALVLECVCAAGQDFAVQNVLRSFCSMTGFRISQTNMALSDVMPTRRDRWWCTLHSPAIPKFEIRDMPKMQPPPVLGDLIPLNVQWPPSDVQQIALDTYESRKFEAFGGLTSKILRCDQVVPTALHGWSSQLTACPCMCRDYPMSEARLEAKGLFGALMLLDGEFELYRTRVPCTRHMHPAEMALVHGVPIDQNWQPLRRSIAGLGQLASPIQACWVASHLKAAIDDFWGLPCQTPEQRLLAHMAEVFRSVEVVMPVIAQHPNFQAFTGRFHTLLRDSHMCELGPSANLAFEVDKALENSQRNGRKDQKPGEEPTQQPASGPREPNKEDQQPASGTPEPNKQPAGGAQEPGQEDKQPAEEMPVLRSGSDVSQCTQSPVHAMSQLVPANEDPSQFASAVAIHSFQPKDQHGGIPAFANPQSENLSAPVAMTQIDPADFADHPESEPDMLGLTQEIAQHMDQLDQADTKVEPAPAVPSQVSEVEAHWIQLFQYGIDKPFYVRVSHGTTIGTLMWAEECLTRQSTLRPCDAVGQVIPANTVTTPFQQVFLRPMSTYPVETSSVSRLPVALLNTATVSRLFMLHHQDAFVAVDEMKHYLELIASNGHTAAVPPCVLPFFTMDDELPALLNKWATECVHSMRTLTRCISALLVDEHWFPLCIKATPFGLQIPTSRAGHDWMTIAFQHHTGVREILKVDMPSNFPDDCGFQTIAWLTHVTFLNGDEDLNVHHAAFHPKDAAVWRYMFEHHLIATGKGITSVTPCDCRFGGTGNVDIQRQLEETLSERGVPPSQVVPRATSVLDRLGRSQLVQIFRGPNPWRDLKAACNNASPKIQLVLAVEMQAAIQDRLENGQPLGNKKVKKQHKPQAKTVSDVQLKPSDISIPDGIFKEGDSVALQQIKMSDIGPHARGVCVTTTVEAVAYLKLTAPVSNKGLALLLVDHSQPILHGIGTLTRLPAKCLQTDEPVLLSAKLVQLGTIPVSRNVAASVMTVDEVENTVIKVLAFRDELDHHDWNDFSSKPVQFIKQDVPVLQGDDVIMDVWDRQFLNLKMSRASTKEAMVYAVSLRVTGIDLENLLQQSGQNGYYFEPRNLDGRGHSADFRVVWLSKVSKPDALLAKQSSKHWVALVRSGNRFGLRVRAAQAEEVHSIHKPTTPFLNSTEIHSFVSGPWPYGATRQSISKVLQQWGWVVRPTQPIGRAADGQGILWNIQASGRPPYDVFQMNHADILISPAQSKNKKSDIVKPSVQGSERTLAALKAQRKEEAVDSDPWVGKPDPWGGWKPTTGPSSKAARLSAPSSAEQSDVIAAQVEKKLLTTLNARIGEISTGDVSMQDDSRVNLLETRMSKLEQVVQSNHDQQTKHNLVVANQITEVQQRVDQQSTNLQEHFDRKLDEQLSHIEKLLTAKKPRNE